MKSIYVYTTASAKKQHFYKIGETTLDPVVRVKQQDGTSSSEKLELLDSWPAGEKSDKAFHEFLLKEGVFFARTDAAREWFVVPGGLEQIKKLWNKFTLGVARPNTYKLRPEQENCVQKAYDFLSCNSAPFLIDAKMRFGKTFVSYKLAQKLIELAQKLQKGKDTGNILVTTYKPSVAASWRSELENHIDFNGWGWRHIGCAEHDVIAADGKPTVTFVSMQMLICGHDDESDDLDEEIAFVEDSSDGTDDVKKTAVIYNESFDLLVVDEVHYGTRTQNAKNIFAKIKKTHTIYLSGTPFKRIASGEFSDSNCFVWSYSDEQEAKHRDHESAEPTGIYDCLPKLTRILPDLTRVRDHSKLLDQYTSEEGFAIEKMFGVNKTTGLFEDQPTVINFLDIIAKNGSGRGFSPWGMKKIDTTMLDHTLWFLPSVAAISALAKLLKNHKQWFHTFDIIQTSGPDKNVSKVTVLQDRLKKNQHTGKKTIILACERFKEGITLPQLGAVFFLNGWSSPESYYQAMFRCQSPWAINTDEFTGKKAWKENCYVFDYNPSRCLRLSYEYAEIESMKTDQTVEESLRRFHDNCPVLDNVGNQLAKDTDQALTFGCANSPTERVASLFWIGRPGLPNLVQALANVRESENSPLFQEITNEIKKGKIYLLPDSLNTSPPMIPAEASNITAAEKKDNLTSLLKKVQTILKQLPRVVFITHEHKVTSCQDIVKFADRKLFKEVTGSDISVLQLMIDHKVVGDFHDRCLLRYSHELEHL